MFPPHSSFDQCDLIRGRCDEASFLLWLGEHPVNTINLVPRSFLGSILLDLHRVAQTKGPQKQLLFLLADRNEKGNKK